MATAKIAGYNESEWVFAFKLTNWTFHASFVRGTITIATVKDFTFVNPNRFVNAVRLDICDKLLKVVTFNQRKNVSEMMVFVFFH